MYEHFIDLEKDLSKFTGSPFVVLTDCCTHAIEIVFRLQKIKKVKFPCKTYLSILMVCHKLDIDYELTDAEWSGEYNFENTNIWDSALKLQPNMYKPGQIQCLSFGNGKPLDAKRGGCILLDNLETYYSLKMMAHDGRNLSISPWQKQKFFPVGYHYNMSIEHSINCRVLLKKYIDKKNYDIKIKDYPDCRKIHIIKST